MQPVTAPCSREFLPAYHTSGERLNTEVWWVVLHDEEAPNARSAAEWFRNPRSGGSAHLCVDDLACYRCLSNAAIPWGASSSFGANTHGLHIEQAGYARWSAIMWRRHWRTLERAAYKTAVHCKLFQIPVRFVTARELPAAHGITTHAEVTQASKRLDPEHAWTYSHTDPGPLWPRRLFMRRVRAHYAGL
jgi:N-acetylmuramoyl-L-alanine amidase